MSSFFSGIQSFFSAKCHGRYLGLILQEIGNRHPDPIISFICKTCEISPREFKSPLFKAEYSFRGENKMRRADLAIFSDKFDLDPKILIEIKYFDKPHENQLPDYLAWKENEKGKSRRVLVLSREPLKQEGLTVRRWGELSKHLKNQNSKSDLISMLIEYLEEEGIVMQDIDSKALLGFFKRILCNNNGSGVLASNLLGPAEFSKLLKNMRLLTQPIDWHFKEALSMAGKKIEGDEFSKKSRIATIDFDIINRYKSPSSKNQLASENIIENPFKEGGSINVFARYSIGHGKTYLRVSYGFIFDINSKSSNDNLPDTFIWAEAHGGALKESEDDRCYAQKKIRFDMVTSKAEDSGDKLEKLIPILLNDVLSQTLDRKSTLDLQQKSAIKLLLRNLSSQN